MLESWENRIFEIVSNFWLRTYEDVSIFFVYVYVRIVNYLDMCYIYFEWNESFYCKLGNKESDFVIIPKFQTFKIDRSDFNFTVIIARL